MTCLILRRALPENYTPIIVIIMRFSILLALTAAFAGAVASPIENGNGALERKENGPGKSWKREPQYAPGGGKPWKRDPEAQYAPGGGKPWKREAQYAPGGGKPW